MWPFVKWILLIVPSLVMAIVGRILAPILPFFVCEDTKRLPKWLNWFNTPTSTADGDKGHQERWPGTSAWQTYVRRVAWYLRNVAYGFDRTVVGITLKPGDFLTMKGNPHAGDLSGVSGWCWRKLYRANGRFCAWQIYAVWHYAIFGTFKCVRVGFGWKLWGDITHKEYAQFFLYFHPVKSSGRKK